MFDTTKDGIAGRLNGLGYAESKESWDFKNASTNEYGNTFILKCVSGEMQEGEAETLIDRFYDNQIWQILIAIEKTSNNEVINRDDLHRKKDLIMADLDNPAHWESFARILKYKAWEIQETENYFVLTINIKVVVKYTY